MVPRAEKDIGVEQQGEVWADLRRGRMLLRPPSEAIRVVSQEEIERVFPLPPLALGDNRPYTLCFDPFTGRILVPIWREVPRGQDNGRRFLKNPEGLVQLRRQREHQIDFGNLPERKVVALVYAQTNSLEAAIRQQVHIMEKYWKGKEAVQIVSLMNWINFQLAATLEGKLNRDSLSSLASQTGEFLESTGLANAKLEIKRRVKKALMAATQPDISGRVNPLVMRLRLRSAYLKAVEREIMPALIERKFGSFLGILLMEREVTRQSIQGAAEALDTMAGITKRGAAVFEQARPKYSQAELQGMEKVLEEIAKSLARVRVLPYLPAAREAAINLVGCREKKRELNREIIGPQIDELFSFSPVVELIQWGYFRGAKERIKVRSYNPLIRVLEGNKDKISSGAGLFVENSSHCKPRTMLF